MSAARRRAVSNILTNSLEQRRKKLKLSKMNETICRFFSVAMDIYIGKIIINYCLSQSVDGTV